MTKITIHRALVELKLLDSKIQKKTSGIIPVGLYQKGKLINGTQNKEDFETRAQSDFDSVVTMIEQKRMLKCLIVASNSSTMVSIGEKQISVSDAINYKVLIEHKKELVQALQQRLNDATAHLNRNNETVKVNCQKLLEAAFGKDNVKISQSDVDAIQAPYMENNEFKMSDKIEVQKKIDSLNFEIDAFEAEVDAVLSEINSITTIEV